MAFDMKLSKFKRLVLTLKSRFLSMVNILYIFIFSRYCVYVDKRFCLAVGDSHAAIFSTNQFLANNKDMTVFSVVVPGATASGLDNPNSVTKAYVNFSSSVKAAPAGAYIVIQLGEVDTGYVIWWRSLKLGSCVQDMLGLAVKNYCKLISEISVGYRPVIISAPLPTISDALPVGEVAKKRGDISVSQRDRTDLTIVFNRKIEEFCLQKNIVFVNLDDTCLDQVTGVVRDEFIGADVLDHHYDSNAYSKILSHALKDVLI